jgi:hypothetical protein
LIITFLNYGGSILLEEQFRSNYGVEMLQFADGTLLPESNWVF